MAILEIVKYGDPRLREKCEPVAEFNDDIKKLIADMGDTLHSAKGLGLAGPQVGVMKRLFVYDMGEDGDGLHALINPKIIKKSGSDVCYEGCLSVPGLHGEVERAYKVTVTGINENGEPVRIKAQELLARCIQHETDHLDGVIFMDLADPETIEPVDMDDAKK
ncbi:MAG: peptide deformylase [Abditibacteriota bacterium]|nr:peptide deformylase [Abditibacteriota bacterium]